MNTESTTSSEYITGLYFYEGIPVGRWMLQEYLINENPKGFTILWELGALNACHKTALLSLQGELCLSDAKLGCQSLCQLWSSVGDLPFHRRQEAVFRSVWPRPGLHSALVTVRRCSKGMAAAKEGWLCRDWRDMALFYICSSLRTCGRNWSTCSSTSWNVSVLDVVEVPHPAWVNSMPKPERWKWSMK